MTMLRMMTGGGVLVAVLATSVPAQAQHRYRGDHYWHHRHAHRDGGGIDGGDVLLGAALIGGAVLVASAIDRGNGQRADDQERPVPPPHYYEPYGEPDPDAPSPEESERQEAVNRCGEAAEADASRYARIAQVGKVDAVDPGPRGWYVRGSLFLRDDYRDPPKDRRGFRCTFSDGRVTAVKIDDMAPAF
ncbi:MAG: hypothetical protein CMN72_12810 [Sphingomonas sp.]|nr:hypothetical protein [Sphingomonas sp.]